MTGEYEIRLQVWPQSTGNGAEADQRAVGDRKRTFRVQADSFDEAHSKAKLIALGIMSHPLVWEVKVTSIHHESVDR